MSKKVIEIKNIRKDFGKRTVLKDVNFDVHEKEVVSIIGSSGSGKSTLLRCINLLEKPTSGQVLIHGKDAMAGDVSLVTLREKAGMVFQQFNLFPRRTALDNVKEGLLVVKKLSDREATTLAKEELAKVGLSDRENHYPRHLSGGQKQRVALARALAMKPDVLLLDEPTSALDPELVGEVEKSIADAAQAGQTMILVSHDMSFVSQVADKVLFLDKGHIIEVGTPDEMINHPKEERTKEFFASYKRTYI